MVHLARPCASQCRASGRCCTDRTPAIWESEACDECGLCQHRCGTGDLGRRCAFRPHSGRAPCPGPPPLQKAALADPPPAAPRSARRWIGSIGERIRRHSLEGVQGRSGPGGSGAP
eukprot:11280770-Alexandrium_andersonii.AAC.1